MKIIYTLKHLELTHITYICWYCVYLITLMNFTHLFDLYLVPPTFVLFTLCFVCFSLFIFNFNYAVAIAALCIVTSVVLNNWHPIYLELICQARTSAPNIHIVYVYIDMRSSSRSILYKSIKYKHLHYIKHYLRSNKNTLVIVWKGYEIEVIWNCDIDIFALKI